jgi:hypothetical protein
VGGERKQGKRKERRVLGAARGGSAGGRMHSWTFRLNAIFTFTVTVLAVLSALNALSVAFLNPEPVATIENVKLQRLPGSGSLQSPPRAPPPPPPAPLAPLDPPNTRARELGAREPWRAAERRAVGNQQGRLSAIHRQSWQRRWRAPGCSAPHARAACGRACMDAPCISSPRERERDGERARPRRSQCLPQLPDGGDAGTILSCGGECARGLLCCSDMFCASMLICTYVFGVGAGRSDPTRRRA